MSDNQHHEYTCPACKGLMTLDIEPGVRFLVTHQLPPCAQSAEWGPMANGARIEVRHVDFDPPAPCAHVWIVDSSGDYCDHCGAERSRVERN
jgi:Zn finger protein HypA/HybF involved in hydrogenase expression